MTWPAKPATPARRAGPTFSAWAVKFWLCCAVFGVGIGYVLHVAFAK